MSTSTSKISLQYILSTESDSFTMPKFGQKVSAKFGYLNNSENYKESILEYLKKFTGIDNLGSEGSF